jgi:hypothetical protein
VTVDGPSPDISRLTGLSIARDGTGGLAYLKKVSGNDHVFVSRLLDGVFQPPERVDSQLAGPSSQPVIAAGDGGVLLVAFINAGTLYAVDRPSAGTPYLAPVTLATTAAAPALAMSSFGKAYLAFTTASGAGNDVHTAFYHGGRWALEGPPLNATPQDDAGTGTGRPAVAAAGDGVGIVVWGEAGHVFSRRVWGTSPSIVDEQADVPSLSSLPEIAADEPVVGAGGDSSYAEVVFHETFSTGIRGQSRVLSRRLHGSQYDGVVEPDGLSTPSVEGADQPGVAVGEYGSGLVTSTRTDSKAVFATVLHGDGTIGPPARADSLSNATMPDPVAAMAGLFSNLVAWQHDPGPLGSSEIRVRYANRSGALGSEDVVSSPSLGPTAAANGLAAAGDITGDAAIGWVQGSGDSTRIVTAQLYEPPSSFTVTKRFGYTRTNRPTLSWRPAHARWGPLRYTVSVDGAPIGQTTGTALRLATPLPDGPHSWGVTAANPAEETTQAGPARVWVDTVPPAVHLSLTGRRRAGAALHLHVSYTDAPPPEPPADASGVVKVIVRWGDGSSSTVLHLGSHRYGRRGRFRITVVVYDRAGNRTTTTLLVRVRR